MARLIDIVTFRFFVLPVWITGIWVVGSVAALMTPFTVLLDSFPDKVFAAPAALLGLIFVRLACETTIVFFKIHDELVRSNRN